MDSPTVDDQGWAGQKYHSCLIVYILTTTSVITVTVLHSRLAGTDRIIGDRTEGRDRKTDKQKT